MERVHFAPGAYVGEVIRIYTKAPRVWHWLSFKQAAECLPQIASYGKSISTAAVLWNGEDGFILPLAKVDKYLRNGAEDSVKFYAQVIIAGPPAGT